MPALEQTISLATMLHTGQMDKAGEPYILHPLRVMLQLTNEHERIVAMLHDVIEDVKITEEVLLRMGYAPMIVNDIWMLSRTPDETYEQFIQRIATAGSLAAIRVKLADLRDNSRRDRIKEPTPKDFERYERYARPIVVLEAAFLRKTS